MSFRRVNNSFSIILFCLILTCLVVQTSVFAIEDSGSDRPVIFKFSNLRVSGIETTSLVFNNRSVRIIQLLDKTRIEFSLNEKDILKAYALKIQGDTVLVTVNHNILDIKPVRSSNGFYYYVPPVYLISGINSLELSSFHGASLKLKSIEMFALMDTYEQINFKRIFGVKQIKSQPPPDPSQLQFDVLHYDLNHIITVDNTYITAVLTLIAKSLDSSNTFQSFALDINSNNGSFSILSVDQGFGTSTIAFLQSTITTRVFINLPTPLPINSMFTVRLFYTGFPKSTGSYNRSVHGSPSRPIIYSESEPYGARDWWPCKDLPDDKATIDTYWTCPSNYFAVSNGKLVSIDTNNDGTLIFHYSESYPISTYLVSIACTNYQFLYGIYTSQDGFSTMTVGNYIYPEKIAIDGNGVNGTIAILDFFSRKFGEYPFITEKYVTATYAINGAMENQTCTSLGNLGFLSPDGRGWVNAHELAHQWFGDKITCKNFDHLWLNEGFATYCEALWQEEQFDSTAYHDYVNNWSPSDSYALVTSDADSFRTGVVYQKGAWVLHMLRHITGDSTFFQTIRNYLVDSTLIYGNALSSDLQRNFETTIGSGTSLNWFFNEWLYQVKRPNYRWTWGTHLESGNTVLDLWIQQIQADGTYTMPLDFQVNDSLSNSTTITVWNNQSIQEFHIPLTSAITINSVLFDPDNWILKYSTFYQTDVSNWEIFLK